MRRVVFGILLVAALGAVAGCNSTTPENDQKAAEPTVETKTNNDAVTGAGAGTPPLPGTGGDSGATGQ